MLDRSRLKIHSIIAVCSKNGIGFKGDLPWRLPNEMAYFTRITKDTMDKSKINVVVMGRRNWESIPPKFKPLSGRINVIMSRTLKYYNIYFLQGQERSPPLPGTYVCGSYDELIDLLTSPTFDHDVENVFNIGGSDLYRVGLDSKYCGLLYLTRIAHEFQCDTFMPEFDSNLFEKIE